MSYILEALKKSQQERELGHVPTLETPTFLVAEEGTRPGPWILLAVGLAMLAVVIALYSALRVAPRVPEPDATTAPGPLAGTGAFGTADERSVKPGPPTATLSAPPGAATPDAPSAAHAPVVSEPEGSQTFALPTIAEPPASPPARPALRQPFAAESQVATELPMSREQQPERKVPPDLVADIEAFKREVREEQSGTTPVAKREQEIAPDDLRLPKDVRERLPDFVMSAHIFDQEPSKRFVLINGLKTREGEESLEAITVEQILPDGAVLRFDGHRFFQHR